MICCVPAMLMLALFASTAAAGPAVTQFSVGTESPSVRDREPLDDPNVVALNADMNIRLQEAAADKSESMSGGQRSQLTAVTLPSTRSGIQSSSEMPLHYASNALTGIIRVITGLNLIAR